MNYEYNKDGSIKGPKQIKKKTSSKNNKDSIVDEAIRRYTPGLYKEIKHNEKIDGKCIVETKSGIQVQSEGEKLIADFLFDNDIEFEYDKLIKFPGDLKCWARPDFILKGTNIIIEYWGMCKDRADNPVYNQNLERKKGLYLQEEMKLIEIFNEDLKNLSQVLREKLESFGIEL